MGPSLGFNNETCVVDGFTTLAGGFIHYSMFIMDHPKFDEQRMSI